MLKSSKPQMNKMLRKILKISFLIIYQAILCLGVIVKQRNEMGWEEQETNDW